MSPKKAIAPISHFFTTNPTNLSLLKQSAQMLSLAAGEKKAHYLHHNYFGSSKRYFAPSTRKGSDAQFSSPRPYRTVR
jgi:hypothetical protein